MANRRVGGMSNMRGNRSFSQPQPFHGGNVNPWQGSSGGGSMNSGLVNQLQTNPSQLALALTSLLQNQQQNPPSLLSLNTSPAFSNQDSFGRYGGSRSRNDIRRHEPYNKNRSGGWRQGGGNKGGRGGKDFKRDNNKKTAGKDSNKDKKDDKAEIDAEEKDDKEKTETDDKEKKYTGIPQGLLHCFVCNKNMWDGESFHKHVRGRAHKQMLQSLDESFHITVNILRESMRLTEEKKLIELNRQERLSKKHRKYEPESTCNMCDLKFLGKIIAHRKTEGHQRLKRFLHPNCEVCNKEFSSRMDWVEHRLTEEHLKQLSEYLEKKRDAEDGNEIIEDNEEDVGELLEDTVTCEDEKAVLELSDDLKDLQHRIPAYKKNRPVATESLKEFSGFVCELCDRSFTTEEIAQAHLKSQRHYHAFVEAAQKKYQKQLDDAAAEKVAKEKAEKEDETKKDKAEENGDDMYDPEEACIEEDGDQPMETQADESKDEDELLNEETKGEEAEGEEEEQQEQEDVEMVEEPPKPAATSPRAAGRRGAATTAAAANTAATPQKAATPAAKGKVTRQTRK